MLDQSGSKQSLTEGVPTDLDKRGLGAMVGPALLMRAIFYIGLGDTYHQKLVVKLKRERVFNFS